MRRHHGSLPPQGAADSKKSGTRGFVSEVLDRTVIAIPLLKWFKDPRQAGAALRHRRRPQPGLPRRIERCATDRRGPDRRHHRGETTAAHRIRVRSSTTTFATKACNVRDARCRAIRELAPRDSNVPRIERAIHKPLVNRWISTVKADAAHSSFAAGGARSSATAVDVDHDLVICRLRVDEDSSRVQVAYQITAAIFSATAENPRSVGCSSLAQSSL